MDPRLEVILQFGIWEKQKIHADSSEVNMKLFNSRTLSFYLALRGSKFFVGATEFLGRGQGIRCVEVVILSQNKRSAERLEARCISEGFRLPQEPELNKLAQTGLRHGFISAFNLQFKASTQSQFAPPKAFMTCEQNQ